MATAMFFPQGFWIGCSLYLNSKKAHASGHSTHSKPTLAALKRMQYNRNGQSRTKRAPIVQKKNSQKCKRKRIRGPEGAPPQMITPHRFAIENTPGGGLSQVGLF